ncbi:MAG: hypothetical protein IKB53_02640, partial [Oscillospiraceae bacterium]|nr:hypothetical protein [Oscillospiraceae bacterium]
LDTNTNSSDARYKELERKYLDGSISPQEADELWRLEGMRGQSDALLERKNDINEALSRLKTASEANNTHLAKEAGEGYTQNKYGGSVFREFDDIGTPLFAKSKEELHVQPTNLSEDKKMRMRAIERFDLKKDEASRLENYVGGMLCYRLNKKMMNESPLTAGEQEIIQSIKDALLKFPSYSGCTYRNIRCSAKEGYNAIFSEYTEGNIITWRGFTSTSKRPNGYPLFGDGIVHMVVEGASGRDIADTYGVPRQQEVTYLPGVKMEVVKVTIANDGYPLIYLKEVSEREQN